MQLTTGSTATGGGHWSSAQPSTPSLVVSFLLAGLGTVMLGPLLPYLLHDWSLSDQAGGLLLLFKFAGAFVGGFSTPRRFLRLGVIGGHVLAAAGFGLFSLAGSLGLALPAMFLAGVGLGFVIASTNVLTGRRWRAKAGSALALMNLFWSLGAVSTGILAAALIPRFGWRLPVQWLAALFACAALLSLLPSRDHSAAANLPASLPGEISPSTSPPARKAILAFGGFLLLYGGLETCLTAWITTFALRIGQGSLLGGQSGFVVLWTALTAGRGLASLAMRRWSETATQRVSLAGCLLLIALLATSSSGVTLLVACIGLGLALAPVFPSTFALFLRQSPDAQVAGRVLAISGLGAALFPWLMGALSTATGSLRAAMLVPASLIPLMLWLSVKTVSGTTRFSLHPTSVVGEDSVKTGI